MEKKSILVGLLIPLFLFIAGFSFANFISEDNEKKDLIVNIPKDSLVVQKQDPKHSVILFAGEKIPIEKTHVKRRLDKAIIKFRKHNINIDQTVEVSDYWFGVIDPILSQYGIPSDFKYMPLIESRFSEKARSHKGASGFWQLMPLTAKHFGLNIYGENDERNHPVKSTHAACKYLKELHRKFGSWTLAAAAYNIGETKLRRHIVKQNNKNYYELDLNSETAEYVYKMIAAKIELRSAKINRDEYTMNRLLSITNPLALQ